MTRTFGTPIQRAIESTRIALFLTAFTTAIAMSPTDLFAQRKTNMGAAPSILPLEINGTPIELSSLGALYLAKNGAVIFGDTKPVSVRIREGRDGTIREIARAGAGPAEFRQLPAFVGFTADSIAAFDSGLKRWSIFSPTGAFVRVLATGSEAAAYATAAAWVTDGALVFNASLDKSRTPLAAVLNTIVADSPNGTAPIVIRQASNGDLWSAPAAASRTWSVYDRAGRKRTTFTFSTPFRLAAANDTVAIGQTVDEDELPQIMRQSLRQIGAVARATSARTSAAGTVDATDAERVAARAKLIALLRTMVGKQEGVYSDSGRYVMSTRALKLELPADYRVDILDANNRGWFAIARDTKAHVTCATGVGMNLVIGWSEAIPYCSQ